MSMVIGTNVASLTAQRHLATSRNEMESAMERLSSGQRINAAGDDAAGMAISQRMDAQINGLNQAVRNANDGIGLVQAVEGAMDEVTNILQRMRELAVQSANDTNTATDRQSLQAEVTQLTSELDRISNQTQYNGIKVLDGNFSNKQIQLGVNNGESLAVSVASTASANIGSYSAESADVAALAGTAADTVPTNATEAQTLTVTGSVGSSTVSITAAQSAKTITAAVNAKTGDTGVHAVTKSQATLSTISAAGSITMEINGTSISSSVVTSSDYTALADNINAKAGTTGVTATLDSAKTSITLTDVDGDDIQVGNFGHSTASSTVKLQAMDYSGDALGTALTLTDAAATDSALIVGSVKYLSSNDFSVTSDDSTANENFAGDTATMTKVSTVDIGTATGAGTALDVIDGALNQIAQERGKLGAVQNRLEHTISNLMNVADNTSAAKSRIADADFATESARLAKSQVLQQAGTAMLAQANAAGQGVLSLLK